jgi:hypothetical protein
VHVVGERHVSVLGPELGVPVVLPGGGIEIGRAHEAAVDDGVRALEVLAVGVAIRIGEIGHDETGHRLAVARGGTHVDGYEVPPLGELGEHALGDIAGGAREDHSTLGHGAS